MKIKDLFDYKYGVNLELINCQEVKSRDKNSVNFVARTSVNNGVTARVKIIKNIKPQQAGTLSLAVSGSVLSCFVQTEDYYSGRDLYVLSPKIDLTLEQKIFYAMCINKNQYRYSYGRSANKTFPNIEIPSLEECNRVIGTFKIKHIRTYNKVVKNIALSVNSWKEFKLSDFFEIIAGKYHFPDEYENGTTPYVSASNLNNGIAQRINLAPDFKGNCIVTGKVGCTAFYQSEDFCATSDVNVLKPKQFVLNKYIGLFIVSIINHSENYKWNYGRQCRVGDTKEIFIKLPTKNNEPDWQFMEQYIKSLPYADRI